MSLKSWGIALLAAALLRPLLLALAGWLVLRVSGIRSPASRHAVWTAVLIGILILPVASVITPHWNLPVLPSRTIDTGHLEPSAIQRPGPPDSGRSLTARANKPSSPVKPPVDAATLVLCLYGAGLMVMLAYHLLGWILLRRLITKSNPIRGRRLRESGDVQSCCRRRTATSVASPPRLA